MEWVKHGSITPPVYCILFFLFLFLLQHLMRWGGPASAITAVSSSLLWVLQLPGAPHMGQGRKAKPYASMAIHGNVLRQQGWSPRAGSWLASGPDDALAFTEHLFWAGCLANRHRSPSSEGNQGMNMAMKKFSSAWNDWIASALVVHIVTERMSYDS